MQPATNFFDYVLVYDIDQKCFQKDTMKFKKKFLMEFSTDCLTDTFWLA